MKRTYMDADGFETPRPGAVTRRDFFVQAAAPFAIAAASRLLVGRPADPQLKLGIASTSFGLGVPKSKGAAPAHPQTSGTYQLLEKCHAFGAAGIQTQLKGDLGRLRARAEELGMWIEGMAPIPRNGDMAPLELALADAREAGASVVRTALLYGRRYETFASLSQWKDWVDQSYRALTLALPIIEKYKITVAIENHKDWTLEEMMRLMGSFQNEFLGVCFDFGNNLSLLDDPMEMAEALGKYTKATHVKDMAVEPYTDGFLLSEVPLGSGVLDLPRMVAALARANPGLHYSLEMITRDPLKVPCLTSAYWTVFPERNGSYLARTLRLVREHASKDLPTISQLAPEQIARVEDKNVAACFDYAREKRLFS